MGRLGQAVSLVVLAGLGTLGVHAAIAAGRALVVGEPWARAAAVVAQQPLALGLAQLFGFGFAFALGLRWMDQQVEVRSVPRSVVLLAIAAGLGLHFPLAELSNLAQMALGAEPSPLTARFLQPASILDGAVILLAVVVIAPITEELLFRGLLVPELHRTYGRTVAVLGTALLFGLVHGHAPAVLAATFAGVVLALLRLRVGALLPCVLVHAASNALPFLLPAALVTIPGVNTLGAAHVPLPWLLGGSALTVAAMFGLLRATPEETL
ncbi:MAG: CPBP family intramembrane glutamic endopeptidase [Myxococcota bacterium]